ncbi:MAG: carbohydrate ABC transporter permease [Oscillospiraceae bacterium]
MRLFGKIVGRVTLALLLLLTLFPFYLMLVNSFKWQNDIIKNPWFFSGEFHPENYVKAFGSVLRPMFNSIIVTVAVIAITIAVSVMAAYAFARFARFPLKNVLYLGIIALLMIPGFVLLIPQYIQVVQLGIPNTYAALILPPAAYSVAMGTFLTRTAMEAVPKSLYEAADIEGAGEFRILFSIVLPLSGSVLATVAIVTGLSAWNNYIWPLVVSTGDATTQIAVALTKLKGSIKEGQGLLLAGYTIASIPLITLFCFASRSFIAGLTQGSVKG